MATTKKAAKPVAKKAAPKQAAPATKKVSAHAKKAAPAKASAPVKKAAPAKKVVPEKKAAPVAKKAAPKAAPKKAAPAAKVVPKKVEKPAKVTAKKAEKPLKKAAPKKAEKPAKAVKPPKPPKPAKPEKAPKAPAEPKVRKNAAKSGKKVKEPVVRAPKLNRPDTKRPIEVGPPPIVAYKQPEKKIVKPEPVKGNVKVPPINTKESVSYQPPYTAMSERSQSEPKKVESLVRYSDSELNEFRDIVTKKLEAAKRELFYFQGLITRKDDLSGDSADTRSMNAEDGSISMEREQLSQMASRQVDFIDKLEKALIRIENKTYGICRETGKLIDKNRLRAVPHATLSLEAKLGLTKHK